MKPFLKCSRTFFVKASSLMYFFCFVLQLEIIDACVNYIEALQSQLDIVKPTKNLRDDNDVSDDDDDDEENDVMNNNNVQNDCKSTSSHL